MLSRRSRDGLRISPPARSAFAGSRRHRRPGAAARAARRRLLRPAGQELERNWLTSWPPKVRMVLHIAQTAFGDVKRAPEKRRTVFSLCAERSARAARIKQVDRHGGTNARRQARPRALAAFLKPSIMWRRIRAIGGPSDGWNSGLSRRSIH